MISHHEMREDSILPSIPIGASGLRRAHDPTDEPHNHPNPLTHNPHMYVSVTTETAADSTGASGSKTPGGFEGAVPVWLRGTWGAFFGTCYVSSRVEL